MAKSEEALIEILQNTTIHGLNHVYSANRKSSKIFWFFLFLIGFGGFLFNVLSLFDKFCSKSVLVNHFVDHEDFIWPDITFCNPTAPYILDNDSVALRHWESTINQTANIVNILSKNSKLFKTVQTYNNDPREIVENAIVMSTMDPVKMKVDDFRKRILFFGYSESHLKIYLIKEYDHHYTDFVKDDSSELFSTQIVQIRNNIPCHTIQIEKSKTIKYSSLHSLKFFVNINYESYEKFNSSYIPRSLLLFISPKNYLPKTDELIILSGINTEVSISQIRSDSKESQTSCREESYKIELYDSLLRSTNFYEGDYEDCRKITSQSLYVENCHCYSPFLPIFKNNSGSPRLCFNASTFSEKDILRNAECMFEVFTNYSVNSTFATVEKLKCERYKQVKCNGLHYVSESRKEIWLELLSGKMNGRMRNFMQNAYEKIFRRSVSNRDFLTELKENIAMLSIKRGSRYGDLKKEKIEYSYSNLISDIGGLMGFCLGLSVVGLLEMVGIAYCLSVKLYAHVVNRKQHKKKEMFKDEGLELNT